MAIKVIKANFLHDHQLRRRFEHEAQVMASLTHPTIVPVHDLGNREKAIADYRKAVELNNDPEATRLAQNNLRRLGVE